MTPTPDPIKTIEEVLYKMPCIDSYCDGYGNTVDGTVEEPIQAQCQYCYETRLPFIETATQAINNELTRARIDELEKLKREKDSVYNTPHPVSIYIDAQIGRLKTQLKQSQTGGGE